MNRPKALWRCAWHVARRAPWKDYLKPKKLSLFSQVWCYTMVDYKRLSNAYDLATSIVSDNIQGDIVECGVWRGGCSAAMAKRTETLGDPRRVWLFDSFEGLPEPTEKDGKRAADYAANHASGALNTIGRCVGPKALVEDVFFDKLAVNPSRVNFVEGWFQDTLPVTKDKMGPIAILRLDGDWYDSTMVCLDHLFDKVVPGGYVIFDDYYHWEGCGRAADDFLDRRNIKTTLHKIDEAGAYIVK